MLKKIIAIITTSVIAHQAQAATPRYSTVVNELYNFNHPYAAQASNELATKMSKMAVSPFSFYRGTAHLFYKQVSDVITSRASFKDEIVNFAVDYTTQVEYDWNSLKTAIQNGAALY